MRGVSTDALLIGEFFGRRLLLAGCAAEQVVWDAEFPQGFHGA